MTETRLSFIRQLIVATASLGWIAVVAGPRLAVAETPREASEFTTGSTFRDCDDGCPEMVVIGPGSFQMGTPEGEAKREKVADFELARETPRHRVTIAKKFALGKYAVTRAEFSAFFWATKYQATSNCPGSAATLEPLRRSALPRTNWQHPGFAQTDRDPVVCVSWNDATAYVFWLSQKTHQRYRLPSEAEWEYAARAGTSATRYWGDGTADACRYANVADFTYRKARKVPMEPDYFDCSEPYVYTSPVGSFLPNSFGLYDMLGNVYQFTEDCLHYNYLGAPSDGSAWLDDYCVPRIRRGGSYSTIPRGIRSAYRSDLPAFLQDDDTGFRVARDL